MKIYQKEAFQGKYLVDKVELYRESKRAEIEFFLDNARIVWTE